MHVVVVSCVFPPEPVVSSRTSFDVAAELRARGHDVTVIAPFPSRPGGRLHAGYRRVPFRRGTTAEGFRLIRCATFLSRRSSLVSRFSENVSFGIMSALALLFVRRPGAVYANTWPVFAGALTALAARLRGAPLVLSVQDIYPESLAAQRRPGGAIARRLLLAIDRRVARQAAAVAVISHRFAEHYRRTRGVDPARLHVVPNWLAAEGTEETPGPGADCRRRHGVGPGDFLLAYGGNVGVAAGVETIIEAFRELHDEPRIHLLIAGEGATLDHCRRLAAEVAPERIHFESPWLDTIAVLHAADAVVLPTRAAQSTASVPSKLISYLLAARPIVAAALPDSDTADMVHASGAGVVVAPDDPRALAAAILAMAASPAEERRRMGGAGRAWALANVTRDVCLPRIVGIIESEAR